MLKRKNDDHIKMRRIRVSVCKAVIVTLIYWNPTNERHSSVRLDKSKLLGQGLLGAVRMMKRFCLLSNIRVFLEVPPRFQHGGVAPLFHQKKVWESKSGNHV